MQTRLPLDVLVRKVTELRSSSQQPAIILDVLATMHGASTRFNAGTNELRLGGVAATNTAGGAGLIDSWLRAAQRKLERTAK